MEILQGNEHLNEDDFYVSLKEKLENNHNFPEDYLFKFIVPSDASKLSEIYKIFDGLDFTMSTKESAKGKYTSCSINAFVLDADQVIRIYKQASKIDDVILL